MSNDNSSYAETATRSWRTGDVLEAGRVICEHLPIRLRPKWAAQLLRLAVLRSGIRVPAIEHVLYTADDPTEWCHAHRVFSVVRMSTLELESVPYDNLTTDQRVLIWLLAIAELVAKVSYNATDPPDPFDEDSGAWLAPCLKGFVDVLDDEEFADRALSTLVSGVDLVREAEN
jgi:hypothetical protein